MIKEEHKAKYQNFCLQRLLACRIATVLAGFDSEERAVLFSRKHVKQTVGTLPYIADTLLEFRKQWFASQLLPLFIEYNPLNLSCPRYTAFTQASNEEVPFPVRKAIARIERHARNADRWQPHDDWVFHSLFERMW